MSKEARTPKTLANWLELDYHRQPRRLRSAARWPAWLLFFLTIGAVGWFTMPQHRRIYQAGELSRGHASFENRCEECHRETGNLLPRFWQPNLRTVADESCHKCHAVGTHQHCANLQEPNCATCHREHQGRILLAQTVTDMQCATCHNDLKSKCPETKMVAAVATFPSTHPDFQPRQFADLGGKAIASPYAITFSHQKHLNLDSNTLKDSRQLQALARLKEQNCSACHTTDSAGRQMLPIQFDRHCADCHQQQNLGVRIEGERNLSGPVAEAAAAFRQVPAPHREPAVVRSVLRQRFRDFATAHPEVVGQPIGPPPRIQLTPGRPPITITAERPEAWADWQTQTATAALFSRSKTGCAFCHQETGRTKEDLPIYAPSRSAALGKGALQLPAPAEPNRWFAHAEFSHARHRRMANKGEPESCLECHGGVNASTHSAAVHMPTKAECASCHKPGGNARNDCIECHRYHHSDQTSYLTPLTRKGHP